MSEKISIDLDASQALQTLDNVDQLRKQSENSIRNLVSMSHAAWLAVQGLVRASGGSISTVFRMAIGTTLGMISMLTPILSAQAATGDYIRAGLGFASLGIAIAAVVAAQRDETDVANALRGANMMIHGVQAMIGNMEFLY